MTRQAVILAGGKGTRLGELTHSRPKPLLEVGGRPFIEYLIRHCRRYGYSKILLLVGPFESQFRENLGNGERYGVALDFVAEPIPAGTAGALTYAADVLEDEFLLLNGDSIFDIDLIRLIPRDDTEWTGVVAVRSMDDTGRYGRVELTGDHVTDFAEKVGSGPGFINGGVYYLRRKILDQVPKLPASMETDILPFLARDGVLLGCVYEGNFIDIGIPKDFARADRLLPQWERKPAVFLDRDGVLNVDSGYVHKPGDFVWIDGAREAVKRLNELGYYVFVVTNQAGVGRGLYSEDAVRELHWWVNESLAAEGAHIDAFYFCPHHPIAGNGPYLLDCSCRKPKPGMLLRAMKEWPIDVSASFLIGDKKSDIETGDAAGVRAYLFPGGNLSIFLDELVKTHSPV